MSLLGYERPRNVTLTIVGTGATIVTDPAKLWDDNPAQVCAFTWCTGAQTTATSLKLQFTWDTPIALRVGALLKAVGLPPGLKYEVHGMEYSGSGLFDYEMGGNSTTQTLGTLDADGSIAGWNVFDVLPTTFVGIEFELFNDVDGATVLAAADPFRLGEVVYMPGEEWGSTDDDTQGTMDPSVTRRGHDNQPDKLQLKQYRDRTVNLSPSIDEAGMLRLTRRLAASKSCFCIRRWKTLGGSTLDAAYVQQDAMFGGMVTPAAVKRVKDSPFYVTTLQLEEYPP